MFLGFVDVLTLKSLGTNLSKCAVGGPSVSRKSRRFSLYFFVPRAYKPDSVPLGDDYLSRCPITETLTQSTREFTGTGALLPYLTLLRVGFARPFCSQNAGALLPHHFTLTH